MEGDGDSRTAFWHHSTDAANVLLFLFFVHSPKGKDVVGDSGERSSKKKGVGPKRESEGARGKKKEGACHLSSC